MIIVENSHWRPGPIRHRPPVAAAATAPRPHVFAPLEVNYLKVNTRITDQVAVTSLNEEFYNPNAARLEGTFVFPIPKGAQFNKFTMEIDGKQVEAELLPADKARRIYEDIVRKLKDPALLEYGGRDVFKVRIFPIEPNSKKRITLSYTELLKADNGLVSYLLPLDTEKFSAKPLKNVSVKVDLESTRPLKSIYSPSHTVEVKRHGANRATAGYEASEVQPDTDFALYFAPGEGRTRRQPPDPPHQRRGRLFSAAGLAGGGREGEAVGPERHRVRAGHLRLDGRQETRAGQEGAAFLRREPQRRRPL